MTTNSFHNLSIDSPVRVLVIGFYGSRGGVETSTMNYYRNFDHNKIQYDFINPYQDFYYQKEITALGGKIYNVSSFKANPIKYMIDVYTIIRKHKYTVVNIPMLSAINLLPIVTSFIARVPSIIVHSHNSNTSGVVKKALHVLNKPVVNMIAHYKWACSTEAAKWLFYKNSQLVNNAIDLNHYKYSQQKRTKIRQEFGIGDEFVIGNVARLTPVKNQTLLLDILAKAHQVHPTAKLMIVGSGECLQELKDKAAQMKIIDRVIFAGDRSDVADLYSAMDVFVLTSKFEGLPMVGVEAQAAGLQVVCTDSVTAEMDVSGRTRYIALAATIESWVSAIMTSTRATTQDSINKLTSGGYNIKIEAAKLEDFYEKIAKQSSREVI